MSCNSVRCKQYKCSTLNLWTLIIYKVLHQLYFANSAWPKTQLRAENRDQVTRAQSKRSCEQNKRSALLLSSCIIPTIQWSCTNKLPMDVARPDVRGTGDAGWHASALEADRRPG
ncbi:hypothetical protein pipiens_011470 [Culex pipiens pipiens]|uniref:Uncharacterized protein n=1 Tax=Culex pipiens pipiens TaxID=38569 RepID=A0ABD1D679_CULPP